MHAFGLSISYQLYLIAKKINTPLLFAGSVQNDQSAAATTTAPLSNVIKCSKRPEPSTDHAKDINNGDN